MNPWSLRSAFCQHSDLPCLVIAADVICEWLSASLALAPCVTGLQSTCVSTYNLSMVTIGNASYIKSLPQKLYLHLKIRPPIQFHCQSRPLFSPFPLHLVRQKNSTSCKINRPPFHILDFILHKETPVVLTELSLSACWCNVPMLQLRLWLPRLHGTWQAVVALAWWLPIMAVHCLQLLTSPRHAAARRHGEMVHLVSSW